MNLLNIRTSYTPLEVIDKFPYFIYKIQEHPTSTHARTKDKEFSILITLKILYTIKDKPISFGNLFLQAGVGYKKSFLNYLNMLQHFNIVQKQRVGSKVYYRILEKGQILLELFSK